MVNIAGPSYYRNHCHQNCRHQERGYQPHHHQHDQQFPGILTHPSFQIASNKVGVFYKDLACFVDHKVAYRPHMGIGASSDSLLNLFQCSIFT